MYIWYMEIKKESVQIMDKIWYYSRKKVYCKMYMDIGQPMVLINKEDVKYIHGNQEINKESVQFMDNQWYCSRKKLYGTWTLDNQWNRSIKKMYGTWKSRNQ